MSFKRGEVLGPNAEAARLAGPKAIVPGGVIPPSIVGIVGYGGYPYCKR